MGKLDLNKQLKRESLLNTAFELFTTKGLNNTSISDIVEKAGVAKGTFYLYFKDKYDINNKLIVHKTSQLFDAAMNKLDATDIAALDDKIIFLVDDVLDSLAQNSSLLIFINKNLGWGIFRTAMMAKETEESRFHKVYNKLLENHGHELRNPDIMIYMIIELVGSCCYNTILYEEPVTLKAIKPYLYHTIRDIVADFTIDENNNPLSGHIVK